MRKITSPISRLETSSLPETEVELEKQWSRLALCIRQEILTDPAVRQELLIFFSHPLDELLAFHALKKLSEANPKIKKYVDRYSQSLIPFLCKPKTSPDRIPIDLKMSVRMHEAGGNGITRGEYVDIARRYRYGRDIKLLTLAAVLLENGIDKVMREGLPQGGWITFSKITDQEKEDFLSPISWHWRRQIKDRVFKIKVGERSYILKEHKTSKHTDTLEGGHVEGLASFSEFSVAQNLHDHSRTFDNTFRVTWERPIGSAHFPDGYEFALFTFERNFLGEYESDFALIDLVKNHRQDFERFYEPYKHTLTYEEFIPVLALRLEEMAIDALHAHAYENGIHPHDIAWGIRIYTTKPYIEIVGMDLEYTSPLYSESVKTLLNMYNEEKYQERSNKDYSSLTMWLDGSRMLPQQITVYKDMVENDHEHSNL